MTPGKKPPPIDRSKVQRLSSTNPFVESPAASRPRTSLFYSGSDPAIDKPRRNNPGRQSTFLSFFSRGRREKQKNMRFSESMELDSIV